MKILEKENKQEWFKSINPLTKIPTYVENNNVMSESGSILRYLASSIP